MANLPAVPTPTAIRIADIGDQVALAIAGTHEDRVDLGRQLGHASHLATWHINFALGDLANAEAPAGDHGRNPERTELIREFAAAIDRTDRSVRTLAETAKAWPELVASNQLTKTVPWITSSDDPDARTRTYRLPFRREGVSFEVHRLLASLPEADRHAAMESVVERGGGKQAAMEFLAEQADLRHAATTSAHARSQSTIARHGADEGNATEAAMAGHSRSKQAEYVYEPPADEDVNWGSADGWTDPAEQPWTAVPTPAGPVEVKAPAPRFNSGQRMESVRDIVAALDSVETAIANLPGVSDREAERITRKLEDLWSMLAEVRAVAA